MTFFVLGDSVFFTGMCGLRQLVSAAELWLMLFLRLPLKGMRWAFPRLCPAYCAVCKLHWCSLRKTGCTSDYLIPAQALLGSNVSEGSPFVLVIMAAARVCHCSEQGVALAHEEGVPVMYFNVMTPFKSPYVQDSCRCPMCFGKHVSRW